MIIGRSLLKLGIYSRQVDKKAREYAITLGRSMVNDRLQSFGGENQNSFQRPASQYYQKDQKMKVYKKSGILSVREQNELFRLSEAIRSAQYDNIDRESDGEDQFDESDAQASSNKKVEYSNYKFSENKMKKEVERVCGFTHYSRSSEEQFLELIKVCRDATKLREMTFYQAGVIIIELGRNGFRKKHTQQLRQSLFELTNLFMKHSPLDTLISHIKAKGTFEMTDFSFSEMGFLRRVIPQVIISLQNCAFCNYQMLNSYYGFIQADGLMKGEVYLKISLALFWTYLKFQIPSIDYTIFLNHFLNSAPHIHFWPSVRILWMCAHVQSSSPENQSLTPQLLDQFKEIFVRSYDKQNLIVFNSKNSIHIIQIFLSYYPLQAMEIINGNTEMIQQLSASDSFFRVLYRCLLEARRVLLFKVENKNLYKIIIHNKQNNTYIEHIKDRLIFNSRFERNVLAVLQNMNPSLEFIPNFYIENTYEVDILVKGLNIAFEVNGSSHYYYNQSKNYYALLPTSYMRQKHLVLLGIKKVVIINQHVWKDLHTLEEMKEYIIKLLRKQNIDETLFLSESHENNPIEFASDNLQHLSKQ